MAEELEALSRRLSVRSISSIVSYNLLVPKTQTKMTIQSTTLVEEFFFETLQNGADFSASLEMTSKNNKSPRPQWRGLWHSHWVPTRHKPNEGCGDLPAKGRSPSLVREAELERFRSKYLFKKTLRVAAIVS